MEPGSTYFFTASILNWLPLLKKDAFKGVVVKSLKYLVDMKKVRVYGYVLMPNHIHVIWKLTEESSPNLQLSFMRYTAQQFKFALKNRFPAHLEYFRVGQKDREYQFWQKKPLAIELYSRKVLEQKLDYIHTNPLQGKWNLVRKPEEYRYSSASYYESGKNPFEILSHYMEDF